MVYRIYVEKKPGFDVEAEGSGEGADARCWASRA